MVLSLFRPRCPLNAGEKAWVEYRLSWLLEHFGAERLRNLNTILPTGEFFPLPYRGEPEQAQAVFQRICEYMAVEPHRYRLHLFDEQTHEADLPPRHKYASVILESHEADANDTEGTLSATLHFHKHFLFDLEFLIAVFSRKIAEAMLAELPSEHGLDESAFFTTIELMPMFFGLGIMAANSVMRERAETFAGYHEWSMQTTGGLTSRDHGYAFALLCWLKGEPAPVWRNHLRRDVEDALLASLRYLEKTSDTILDRDFPAKPYFRRRVDDWLKDAKSGTPSRRIAALWSIQDQANLIRSEHVAVIAENLSHRDAEVRKASATAIEEIGETASDAIPELLTATEDRHASVRSVAALALGAMTSHAEDVLPGLLPMLNDRNVHVSNAAAWAVGQFGRQAEDAGPALARLLRRGVLRCTQNSLNDILDALLAVSDHPEEVVMESLLERDPETCDRALNLLKERQIDRRQHAQASEG